MTYPTIATLEQAYAHLRLTDGTGNERADLEVKLAAATQIVCDYISDKRQADGMADPTWITTIEGWDIESSPQGVPPPLIVAAVLEQTAELYRFRGDDLSTDKPTQFQQGFLSPSLTSLLARYRTPVLS